MTAKRGRGRPSIAAQSLDEALQRHYAGESPPRPRNAFEREVKSKGKNGKRGGGREVNPLSPTQQAATLAAYLVRTEDIPLREAARRAAEAHSLKPDSFRKQIKRLLDGPRSTIRADIPPSLRQLVGGQSEATESRPLLVSVEDLPPL